MLAIKLEYEGVEEEITLVRERIFLASKEDAVAAADKMTADIAAAFRRAVNA